MQFHLYRLDAAYHCYGRRLGRQLLAGNDLARGMLQADHLLARGRIQLDKSGIEKQSALDHQRLIQATDESAGTELGL